jgi:hypothetical protein
MLVVSMCEGAEVVFAVTAGYGWQVGQLLFIGYFSTTRVEQLTSNILQPLECINFI